MLNHYKVKYVFSAVVSLLFIWFLTVICNFRSPICQALVLEIGETVQILEKSEGNQSNLLWISTGTNMMFFFVEIKEQFWTKETYPNLKLGFGHF